MKADWKKVKLGDLCEITSSKRFHLSERTKNGVPFYCTKEILQKLRGEEDIDCDYIDEKFYLQIKEKFGVPVTDDLLLTTRGTIGFPYLYKDTDKFYFADGNLSWFRNFSNSINSHFLYYWFLSSLGKAGVDSIAKGTAQKAVPITGLGTLEISLPPLETQQKIASILSAYDDLIENNRKQIKLLEEAAQRLYKEWFVDLRFPGYENVAIVDGVPEGWRIEQLGSLLPIVTGKKDANFGTKDGMYPFFTCSQEPIKAPSYSFDANAILLAGNGDLNVKIFRGKFEAYQRTYVLVPNEQEHLFICYRTVQDNLRKLIHGASGSTIKFITKGMIENIDVIIPQDEILIKFNILSDNILKKMEKLQRQIYLSQQARDKLLPRLMSGDMEV